MMQVIRKYPFARRKKETSLALGYFDGMHIGHQTILKSAIDSPYQSGVVTFDKHPYEIIPVGKPPKKLMSLEDKLNFMEKMGVDMVYLLPFDREMMQFSPKAFIENIIVNTKARKLSVGFNFNFGYRGQGTGKVLQVYGKQFGFDVEQISAVKVDGRVVSSTLIRGLIEHGKVKECQKFLGRRYGVCGKVVGGKKLGRTIGVPTANIFPDLRMAMPKNGVYVSRVYIGSKAYYGISNIGRNPTFENGRVRCETNIFDFHGDLYGRHIRVEFEEFVRPEKKFDGVEALVQELDANIQFAKAYIRETEF